MTATITGSSGDDSGANAINGTSGNDVIAALGGDDEINGGGGGQDIICAGGGEDTVVTLGGNDFVAGQGENDDITTGPGDDFIDGGQGTDVCDGGGQELDRIAGCTNPTEFLPGQSAPDLIARTAFDNQFKLSDFEGEHVLLDFSTIWCPPSDYMASYMAGVQQTIRDAGVPFTYVLIELEDAGSDPSERRDAEVMTERYSLFDSPVLHAEGTRHSMVTMQHFEYSAENFPWLDNMQGVAAFPTLVYINKKGKINDVEQGAPANPNDIVERYVDDAPDPPESDRKTPKLPGVQIESLAEEVDDLEIGNKPKREMKKVLTSSLRALELRVGPKKSPCSYLKQFRKLLKKTNGVTSEQLTELTGVALNVENLIGCG